MVSVVKRINATTLNLTSAPTSKIAPVKILVNLKSGENKAPYSLCVTYSIQVTTKYGLY